VLLGGFRKCDADDPEIYSRSTEQVLARYDVDIQRRRARAGGESRRAYELRERCEALAKEGTRRKEREERAAQPNAIADLSIS
jgi:hypothetical protein